MKKKILVVLFTVLILSLALCLVACAGGDDPATQENPDTPVLLDFTGITFSSKTVDYDGEQHSITCEGVPDGATVTYTNNVGTLDGVYNAKAVVTKEGYNTLTLNATLTIQITPEQIVRARANVVSEAKQNYDFKVNLAGTLGIAGISGTANANYDGQYRYDATSNELKFKRTTSGALLYDSVEYIYNTGSSKIKVIMDENGEVKRTSVVPEEEEGLNLINLPFEAIVNHTEPNNLTEIRVVNEGGYRYKANLAIASNNAYVQTLISVIGALGTNVEMGDVSISNPANGIDFYFNLSSDRSKLTDFKFSAEVAFPIKGIDTVLTVNYEQKANESTVSIPSISDIVTDTTTISTEMSAINTALLSVKNSNQYSLDVEAVNDFDPAWNSLAIVDKYVARMYKNTVEGRVDFNHSFEYKAHSEEDGAETYKYTYGNIQDGSVHLVSRKGTNAITATPDITASTQFDYLVGLALINGSEVDCLKKEVEGTTVTYKIYLKKATTLALQDKILDMINSNDADGVLDVNNYFNASKNIIEDACMEVEMVDGKVASVKLDTKIKYNPTGGEYTEEKITLKNSIRLTIDESLDKAMEYEAPKGTSTSLSGLGLNNAKYYIL